MVSWLFLQTFPVVEFLTPDPSGFFTANSCPLCGSVLQSHFLAPSPLPQLESHNSGWGALGCSTDHAHSSYSVLPSADLLQKVSFEFPKVSFCSNWLPHCEGIFPFLTHSHTPCFFWFFFFLSFILPGCKGIFLVLLGVQRLQLMFSRCSVITGPFADVFLM